MSSRKLKSLFSFLWDQVLIWCLFFLSSFREASYAIEWCIGTVLRDGDGESSFAAPCCPFFDPEEAHLSYSPTFSSLRISETLIVSVMETDTKCEFPNSSCLEHF